MTAQNDDNLLLEFYKTHNISPVHQDIGNFAAHLARREKLYRQLGIPVCAFRNNNVMEVGPGGGFNSLTLLAWGSNPTLVEPNPKGAEEIIRRLAEYGYGRDRWTLFNQSLEQFESQAVFDVIMAEGFIPGLNKREPVIEKLKSLSAPGGIVVVTCVDDIGFLFENLRRILAFRLMKDVTDLKKQVKILADAFASHYQTLKFATRPVEDWVTDQFICPTFFGRMFSVEDCINEFGAEFALMGASPSIFTDISWYKNISIDTNKQALEQFARKRHIFIQWTLDESERDPELNRLLLRACTELGKRFNTNAEGVKQGHLQDILPVIGEIRKYAGGISPLVDEALLEIEALLNAPAITVNDVSSMKSFSKAIGRGMQYVAMTRLFAPLLN